MTYKTYNIYMTYNIFKFLIFDDVLQHVKYIVMSPEIRLSVFQCVVSQGLYQCLNTS